MAKAKKTASKTKKKPIEQYDQKGKKRVNNPPVGLVTPETDKEGFEVLYVFRGVVHKYRPDIVIRLKTAKFLVLETKGQDTDQDKTKRAFLDEWVNAVNEHGGFGNWSWALSKKPGDVVGILEQAV